MVIQPASLQIQTRAENEGLTRIFQAAGAKMAGLGCGACIGLGLGRAEDKAVMVSAINRNFPGRMGGEKTEIYLASPATVAISAIQGYLGN